ncbi:SDR family oxidoreductase [Olivibacter sitiensis]|uniref:SDR family oxidoreductase n=1 Tax=Olivibacter sitiensis TaxID=376470 RepID=UPI0003F743FD|nr:SDR family oxidoreductase [Olivibacter sitiensis]
MVQVKKILVTGANGLVGQKLAELLQNDERFDWRVSSRGDNRNKFIEDWRYISCELKEKAALSAMFDSWNPDVVIHTAAMANADACERDPSESHRVNVEAVQTILELCEARGIHLIHLSTDFVFDGEEGPYDEEDEPNPVNLYGEHKAEAERLIQASKVNWAIVRTILVYGVLPSLSRSNIVLWAKQALENGQSITVVNDQWRMPTLAEDLADACLTIADRGAKGIYHISGKDEFSICDMVDAIAEFWQLEKSYICKENSQTLQQDAKRPKRTGFILEKAYEELDYVPHSFGEGLRIVDRQLKEIAGKSG